MQYSAICSVKNWNEADIGLRIGAEAELRHIQCRAYRAASRIYRNSSHEHKYLLIANTATRLAVTKVRSVRRKALSRVLEMERRMADLRYRTVGGGANA